MPHSTVTETDLARHNTEIVLTAMRELFIEKDLTLPESTASGNPMG